MKLFDSLTRHQMYVEGVKLGFAFLYGHVLRQMYLLVVRLLTQSRYQSLDQMTLPELRRLIQELSKEQKALYQPYLDRLLGELKRFVVADDNILTQLFANVTGKAVIGNHNEDYIWNVIANDPNPATGFVLQDQVNSFINSAMAGTVALISKGYANAWTTQQALQELAGETRAINDGLLSKLAGQNQAMVATLVQHSSQTLQSAVASQFFERYVWVSILDNHTTPICLQRNGIIYVYGEGPLPPAHYFCRSNAVPWTDEQQTSLLYHDWLMRQPQAFQHDIFGALEANRMRTQQARLTSFSSSKPLTVSQFASKLPMILKGD